MPEERRQWGSRGESLAGDILQQHGYRILARNVRTPLGEIDLVARHGDTLVFIEVKLRRSLRFGPPTEAVTPKKQQRLRRAAQYYLRRLPQQPPNIRFDVVAITWREADPQVQIIPGAF